MTSSLSHRLAAITGLLLLGSIPLEASDAPPAAAAKKQGDLWEVTSQMSMEEMPVPMPAQKLQVCAPKEWKEPPGGTDAAAKCKVSDFQVAGSKATWKVSCSGPPEMTGEGEITRNGDTYAGFVKLTSSDVVMTVKLNGRRVGDCDPGK